MEESYIGGKLSNATRTETLPGYKVKRYRTDKLAAAEHQANLLREARRVVADFERGQREKERAK